MGRTARGGEDRDTDGARSWRCGSGTGAAPATNEGLFRRGEREAY